VTETSRPDLCPPPAGTSHTLQPSLGSSLPPVTPIGHQRLRLLLGGVFPAAVDDAEAFPTALVYAYPSPALPGVGPALEHLRVGSRRALGPWTMTVTAVVVEPPSVTVQLAAISESRDAS
jgi:hypothetical protein